MNTRPSGPFLHHFALFCGSDYLDPSRECVLGGNAAYWAGEALPAAVDIEGS